MLYMNLFVDFKQQKNSNKLVISLYLAEKDRMEKLHHGSILRNKKLILVL